MLIFVKIAIVIKLLMNQCQWTEYTLCCCSVAALLKHIWGEMIYNVYLPYCPTIIILCILLIKKKVYLLSVIQYLHTIICCVLSGFYYLIVIMAYYFYPCTLSLEKHNFILPSLFQVVWVPLFFLIISVSVQHDLEWKYKSSLMLTHCCDSVSWQVFSLFFTALTTVLSFFYLCPGLISHQCRYIWFVCPPGDHCSTFYIFIYLQTWKICPPSWFD